MSNNSLKLGFGLKPFYAIAMASALAVGCGDSYTSSQKSDAVRAAAESCEGGDRCEADISRIEASQNSSPQTASENARVSDTALEAEAVSVLSANTTSDKGPVPPLEKVAPPPPPAVALDVELEVEVEVEKDEVAKTTVTVNKSSDSDDKPTPAQIHLEKTREKAICNAQGGTYNERTGRCQR